MVQTGELNRYAYSKISMQILATTIIFLSLLHFVGCSNKLDTSSKCWISIALSAPEDPASVLVLQSKINESGINCVEGFSSLGTISIMVDSQGYNRAKDEARKIIFRYSLSAALHSSDDKVNNILIYEEYSKGKKTGERIIPYERNK